jgi:hypothetical protein
MRLDQYTRFKNCHAGKEALVLLNGPSLNVVPLDHVHGITFGANQIYRTYTPVYYVNTGGKNFSEDFMINEIMALMDDDRVEAAFLNRLAAHVFRHSKAYTILSSDSYPDYPPEQSYGFSFDPLVTIGIKGSVLYPILQIAYYMGIKRVNLVGFDYNYEEGREHFYPEDDRFEKAPGPFYDHDNEKWQDTNDVILTACKEIFENDGREIVNWTPESHCKILRKEKPPWHD